VTDESMPTDPYLSMIAASRETATARPRHRAAGTDVVQWARRRIRNGGSVSIDPGIVGRRYASGPISWSSSQALLYALGVGAGGSDAHDELAFTTENSHGTPQRVLPTFAVVLGAHGADGEPVSPVRGAPEIPLAQILHGEQTVTLHGALPVAGTATFTGRISAVHDTGRHAVVENVAELRDAATGDLLAGTVSSMVVRDAGGFGGPPGTASPWALPERPADVTLSYRTRRDQALLYRLSGDRNPLHSDPWFARSAGSERPILHGLCTYGFTGRALLRALCDNEPERFDSMYGRFSRPVLPGDELIVSIWREPAQEKNTALFRTATGDGTVVIDKGRATFH
jgi:acyl dehydratase